MTKETQVTCPIEGCKRILVHHDILGVPSPADPLHIDITKNVYECQDHGLLAYLGDRRFRRISN
jgi:hypothetical protein